MIQLTEQLLTFNNFVSLFEKHGVVSEIQHKTTS